MILEHYTDQKLPVKPEQREYIQAVRHKPRGFWVSANGFGYDWPWFIDTEDFHREKFTHKHFVKLADGANILRITNGAEFLAFHNEYSACEYPDVAGLRNRKDSIDWARVSGNYDGIMIAPYQWPFRLHSETHWYYGWDVASGCIWNMDAIETVEYAIPNPIMELERVNDWLDYQARVMLLRANNQMSYGTPDPTGGAGPMPLTFEQWRDPFFYKMVDKIVPPLPYAVRVENVLQDHVANTTTLDLVIDMSKLFRTQEPTKVTQA